MGPKTCPVLIITRTSVHAVGLLLLGLFLGIPFAILANVWTPKVQARLDTRNKDRSDKRLREQAKFREEVDHYRAAAPEELGREMTAQLIRIAYYGAIFGILSGASFAAGQLIQGINDVSDSYSRAVRVSSSACFIGGQVAVLFGTLVTLNIARAAYRLYTAARSAGPRPSVSP
jgi:H+/gluconate symporter-like permease